jgi:hypothetical protein
MAPEPKTPSVLPAPGAAGKTPRAPRRARSRRRAVQGPRPKLRLDLSDTEPEVASEPEEEGAAAAADSDADDLPCPNCDLHLEACGIKSSAGCERCRR